MSAAIGLFLRLFHLILLKIAQISLTYTTSAFHSFIFTIFVKPITLGVNLLRSMRSFAAYVTGLQGRPPAFKVRQPKVGIAILTRFPIADRACIPIDSPADNLLSSLKNDAYFERVLAELTASCVVEWLDALRKDQSTSVDPRLYLVYRKSFTSAFSLDGWFNHLPDFTRAKEVYEANQASNRVAGSPSPHGDHLRASNLVNTARHNASHRASWEDPDVFCYARSRLLTTRQCSSFRTPPTPTASNGAPSKCCWKPTGGQYTFNYVTVEGLGYDRLLEVAVRSSLTLDSDYVIVVNPRAIGLRPEHLTTALKLLTNSPAPSSCSSQLANGDNGGGVSIVLGVTRPTSPRPEDQRSGPSDSSASTTGLGLYLIGLRAGRQLMLSAHVLTQSIAWSSLSASANNNNNNNRLWANLRRFLPQLASANLVCMRERLEELTCAQDLLSLERHLGIPCEYFLEDMITLIIPVGPGHLDDDLDSFEDMEVMNATTSKSLASSLELAVYNASGRRRIEIIIIDSSPRDPTATSEQDSDAGHTDSGTPSYSGWFPVAGGGEEIGEPASRTDSDAERRFRGTRLPPMVTVRMHHFRSDGDSSDYEEPPRRGQLIRYAVDNLAKGSILVFIDPGVQLPPRWDSAVFHTLQRPGVGMGCFAYRLHLHDKYIHRKSVRWACNLLAANFLVEHQMRWFGLPITGQPHFIYTHYLACLGGYPTSSRGLHAIDLARACHNRLGPVALTRCRTASAGVPASFALRHGACRTAIYISLFAVARCLGASELELATAVGRPPLVKSLKERQQLRAEAEGRRSHGLPLVQPAYLDGY